MIKFLEYGTNVEITECQLSNVPREGEFVILNNKITSKWKDQFYRVRAVTYLIDSTTVIVHIEKYDIDAENQKWTQMMADIKSLGKRQEDKNGN